MASSTPVHSAKTPLKTLPTAGTQLQRAIARIADGDCPVLIAGERGVGKRTVAQQIHSYAHQPRGLFKEIDCQQADRETLEAAFSANGTVYLFDIADLSHSMQELILSSYFHSEKPRPCRLLCGTSRDLAEEVRSLRMRENFYHLVSAVTLRVAPLRIRKAEILLIAEELLAQYSQQFDRPKPVFSKETVNFLTEHIWPGNLSELQTAIKTLVAIDDQAISLAVLKAAASGVNSNVHREPMSLKQATRAASSRIERQLISEVLASTGGNRKRAADELRISYKALLYKLKQIGAENQSPSGMNGVTP